MKAELGKLTLERLMRYHRVLAEATGPLGSDPVTSAVIAAAVEVDPTQVRKDLGAIGLRGRGRVGFDPNEVIGAIRQALSFDQTHLAVLVGVGPLGEALAAYRGFAKYGLKIVAAFDIDPEKVGQQIAGCPILHTRAMRSFVRRHGIRLAILATPVAVSQGVADRLVAAGIKGIWNFAPLRLRAPQGVCVRDEHISLGLSQLAYHLKE